MSELTLAQQAVADAAPADIYGFLGVSVNEYGAPVDVCRCRGCKRFFTVCPSWTDRPGKDGYTFGDGCLADTCSTYDISRDIDMFFEPMADHGLIKREATDD